MRVSKDSNAFLASVTSFREIENSKKQLKKLGQTRRESLMKMNTTGYDAHRAAKQASSPDVYINANLKPQAESIPDYLRSSQTD